MCLGCNPEYHNKKLAKVKAKVNAVKISQSSKPRLKLNFLESKMVRKNLYLPIINQQKLIVNNIYQLTTYGRLDVIVLDIPLER